MSKKPCIIAVATVSHSGHHVVPFVMDCMLKLEAKTVLKMLRVCVTFMCMLYVPIRMSKEARGKCWVSYSFSNFIP